MLLCFVFSLFQSFLLKFCCNSSKKDVLGSTSLCAFCAFLLCITSVKHSVLQLFNDSCLAAMLNMAHPFLKSVSVLTHYNTLRSLCYNDFSVCHITFVTKLCTLTRLYLAGRHPKLKLSLSLNRAALAKGNLRMNNEVGKFNLSAKTNTHANKV